jgi:hypothetical protein
VPTCVACWSPSGALYEAIRPEPQDLAGLPLTGLDVNWGYTSFWAQSEAFTEGALTRATMTSCAGGLHEHSELAEQRPVQTGHGELERRLERSPEPGHAARPRQPLCSGLHPNRREHQLVGHNSNNQSAID